MSDDQPTQTGDLGEMPEPEIEPREPNPGGADAVPEEDDGTLAADLDPADNPAVQDYPDPLKEAFSDGEDTTTEATRSDDGAEVAAEDESPA